MAFLKSLFKKASEEASDDVLDAEDVDHYEQLEQLKDAHEWINVMVTKSNRNYQSMILAVDVENQELLIDELFPAEHLESIEPGDGLEISTQPRAKMVSFYSRILAREFIDGNGSWRIELPTEIGAANSRNAYRVYVEGERNLNIEMYHEGELLTGTRIINLSSEGLKLSVSRAYETVFKKHKQFLDCVIYLPDGFALDCDIDLISHYKLVSPSPHILAGGKLNFHQPQQRVKLQQYLAAVQRRQLRNSSGIS